MAQSKELQLATMASIIAGNALTELSSTEEALSVIEKWRGAIVSNQINEISEKIQLVNFLNQIKNFIISNDSNKKTHPPPPPSTSIISAVFEGSTMNRRRLVEKFLALESYVNTKLLAKRDDNDDRYLIVEEKGGIKFEKCCDSLIPEKEHNMFSITSSNGSIECNCIQTPSDSQFNEITKMKPPMFTTYPIAINRQKQNDDYRKEFKRLLKFMNKNVSDSEKPCGLVIGEEFIITVPQDLIKSQSFIDSIVQLKQSHCNVIHIEPNIEKCTVNLSIIAFDKLIALVVNPCSIGPIFTVSLSPTTSPTTPVTESVVDDDDDDERCEIVSKLMLLEPSAVRDLIYEREKPANAFKKHGFLLEKLPDYVLKAEEDNFFLDMPFSLKIMNKDVIHCYCLDENCKLLSDQTKFQIDDADCITLINGPIHHLGSSHESRCGYVVGSAFQISFETNYPTHKREFEKSCKRIQERFNDLIHCEYDLNQKTASLSITVPGKLIGFYVNPRYIGPMFIISLPKSIVKADDDDDKRASLVDKFMKLDSNKILDLLEVENSSSASKMGIMVEHLDNKDDEYFNSMFYSLSVPRPEVDHCDCLTPVSNVFQQKLAGMGNPLKFVKRDSLTLLEIATKPDPLCGMIVVSEILISFPSMEFNIIEAGVFDDSCKKIQEKFKDVIHCVVDVKERSLSLSIMVPGKLIAIGVNPASLGPIFVVSHSSN